MRESKAKKIKREIYGDYSSRNKSYSIIKKVKSIFDPEKRATYQKAKKRI